MIAERNAVHDVSEPDREIWIGDPDGMDRVFHKLGSRLATTLTIVISKSGKPRAALVPLTDVSTLRVAGKGRGKWRVNKGFDSPLPKRVIEEFEK